MALKTLRRSAIAQRRMANNAAMAWHENGIMAYQHRCQLAAESAASGSLA
jgi:hypothetical protein